MIINSLLSLVYYAMHLGGGIYDSNCSENMSVSDGGLTVEISNPDYLMTTDRLHYISASLVNNSPDSVAISHMNPLIYFNITLGGVGIYPEPGMIYLTETIGINAILAPLTRYGGGRGSWQGVSLDSASEILDVGFLVPGHYQIMACARFGRYDNLRYAETPEGVSARGEDRWVRSEILNVMVVR